MSQHDTNFHSQFGQFSEKKKKMSQSSLKIRAVFGGYGGNYGWLTRFFMFEPVVFTFKYIALVIWGNSLEHTEVTLKHSCL